MIRALVRHGTVVILLVWLGAAAGAAPHWRARVRGASYIEAIAIDQTGSVLSAIPLPAPQHGSKVALVKLGARAGAERWRHRYDGSGTEHSDSISALLVTRTGDPITAGGVEVVPSVLATDGAGRAAFGGMLLQGTHGRARGFVALVPPGP